MTSGSVDKRHVSTASFDRFLASRVPVVVPVQGTPEAFIFIEPLKPELGLRIEVRAEADAPETGLRNIIARIVVRDGKRFLEVVITALELFRDAYPVLCSMADRVQIGGMSPASALRATIDKISSLLRVPDSMSRERETGLFGELLVICGLIGAIGAEQAVQAWRGGHVEEHDFGFPALDVEVKTTSGERRTHWIESVTQLIPTRDRPLWLISHQLTTAGTGYGHTLSDLVEAIRSEVGSEAARDAFEAGLAGSGWREEARERLVTRWTRRAESLAFRVVGAFPRLTRDALRRGGHPLDRILEVRYRIDVEGLERPPDIPEIITTAIGFEG